MASSSGYESWLLDQLTKSEFFHQRLHEWGLMEVAFQIESVRGEALTWDLDKLGVSEEAWNKVIHRGLMSVPRAVGYYRMLAMVSQKSMSRIGLSTVRYEQGRGLPDEQAAWSFARRLNGIISRLVEADEEIDAREFDLWRGMAAGSQAQGSWQNTKGKRVEILVKGIFQRRLRQKGSVLFDKGVHMQLKDGRTVVFADEPDVGVYEGERIVAAVEIKGGIDTAGVLERVGAAIKSLSRAKESNPDSVTVLVLQGVSVTQRAQEDLETNKSVVNHWFTVEELLDSVEKRERLFALLAI